MKIKNVRQLSGMLIATTALIAAGCNSSSSQFGSQAGSSNTSTPGNSTSSSNGSPQNALDSSLDAGTGAVNVTTYHNDLFRDGANLNETLLNRTNVNPTDFGKVGALPVDGLIYAQPLVMTDVNIPGSGAHDLVFVETEHDSVYAFDTQTLSTTPVWHRNFLGDSVAPCPSAPCTTASPVDVNAPNVSPEIGITATPVIDPVAGTIYITAMTKENGNYFWRLHALDIATGAERQGSPVVINADFPGMGDGMSTNGLIFFSAINQLSRAGLVLNNGMLYIAFSSFNDNEPDHGWVFAYNASTLGSVSAWMTTPNSGDGTIWMSGGAPAVDTDGSLIFATGNGDANFANSVVDLADSVVKLNLGAQGLALEDSFTPYNRVALAVGDVDLGSGGVVLLPDQTGAHPHLMIAGGKEGTIYLLNRDSLGGLNSATGATSDPQIVQELIHVLPGGTNSTGNFSTPSYYQGKIFVAANNDFLHSIPLTNGQLNWNGMTENTQKILHRGATTSVSANGSSNGIVWYLDSSAYTYTWAIGRIPPTLSNGSAVLYAYSTDDLSKPLYSSPVSNITPTSNIENDICTSSVTDAAGCAVKFATPTIANGQVFVGTNREVSVYGLRKTGSSARLINLSARADVGTGGNILIAGFVVGGTGSKSMLIRGDGPALKSFGVAGTLADPILSLFDSSSTMIASNQGWNGNPVITSESAAVGAFALPAATAADPDADSALFTSLAPGAYTAQVSGANGGTGVALAELYDADATTSSSRLLNISARAEVGTGGNVLIAGFVVGGTGNEQVLIRGIGPALSQFGVPGALANPVLTVFDSAGNVIAANAGWDGSAYLSSIMSSVGAFALSSTSQDAALVLTLPAGAYTAQVSGANNTTGVALAEIYEIAP